MNAFGQYRPSVAGRVGVAPYPARQACRSPDAPRSLPLLGRPPPPSSEHPLVREGRRRAHPGTDPDDYGAPSGRLVGEKSVLLVEAVDALHLFGEVDLNSKLVVFLAQASIPVHVYDYYGNYAASLYPREYLLSGRLTVAQVQHYLCPRRRLVLSPSLALLAELGFVWVSLTELTSIAENMTPGGGPRRALESVLAWFRRRIAADA